MTDPAAVERLILATVALAETAIPGRWITAHEVAVRAGLWPERVQAVLAMLCAAGGHGLDRGRAAGPAIGQHDPGPLPPAAARGAGRAERGGSGVTKLLSVTGGLYTLVDDSDFAAMSRFRWFLNKGKYAYREAWANGKRKGIPLHRELLSFPDALKVDHINHDTLDNRRVNLRPVTNSQNLQNSKGARIDSATGVRGVAIEGDMQRSKRYSARVVVNGKQIRLGVYATIAEAEKAVKAGRARLMTHAPECRESADDIAS